MQPIMARQIGQLPWIKIQYVLPVNASHWFRVIINAQMKPLDGLRIGFILLIFGQEHAHLGECVLN
jgi:hypothetical protein